MPPHTVVFSYYWNPASLQHANAITALWRQAHIMMISRHMNLFVFAVLMASSQLLYFELRRSGTKAHLQSACKALVMRVSSRIRPEKGSGTQAAPVNAGGRHALRSTPLHSGEPPHYGATPWRSPRWQPWLSRGHPGREADILLQDCHT